MCNLSSVYPVVATVADYPAGAGGGSCRMEQLRGKSHATNAHLLKMQIDPFLAE